MNELKVNMYDLLCMICLLIDFKYKSVDNCT